MGRTALVVVSVFVVIVAHLLGPQEVVERSSRSLSIVEVAIGVGIVVLMRKGPQDQLVQLSRVVIVVRQCTQSWKAEVVDFV